MTKPVEIPTAQDDPRLPPVESALANLWDEGGE